MADVALGALGQVSRHVLDIEASTTWYRDVLGIRHLYKYGKLSFFDCDGLRLYLQESPEAGAESVLYFRVGDIGATFATLTERGVEFLQAPHLIHRHENGIEEWMSFFADLEGRPLALMAQKAG